MRSRIGLVLLAACGTSSPDGILDEGTLAHPQLHVATSPATGRPHIIRAQHGAHLAFDDATQPPIARARGFLARYGHVLGIAAPLVREKSASPTLVRVEQLHGGLPVLG